MEEPTEDTTLCVGLPTFLLEKDGEIRESTGEEALKIMRLMYE